MKFLIKFNTLNGTAAQPNLKCEAEDLFDAIDVALESIKTVDVYTMTIWDYSHKTNIDIDCTGRVIS